MKNKYICRHDTFWRFRLRLGIERRNITKNFNFRQYGGIKKALQAALTYRDAVLRKEGLSYWLDYDRAPNRYSRTSEKKPCIGVHLQRGNYGTTFNWCSDVYDGKRNRTRTCFAINVYGNQGAFLKACKVRFLHSGPLIISDLSALPCEPGVPYKIIRNKK